LTESVGTAEDLHAEAAQATGLADFGPDDYTDGLAVLLASLDRDRTRPGWLRPTGPARTGGTGATCS
jgi:hypothetical protein